jgi:hypothetical protein
MYTASRNGPTGLLRTKIEKAITFVKAGMSCPGVPRT